MHTCDFTEGLLGLKPPCDRSSVGHSNGGKIRVLGGALCVPLVEVERLFSQCKIMLTFGRNRLQANRLEALEYVKSWDVLEIRLP